MNRLNKEELIELIESLNLDKEDFVLLSSGALVIRGIMDDAGDLDIAVNKSGFNKLNERYNLELKNNNFYKVNDRVECIICDMDKDLIDGYYVQDIFTYLEYLESSNREKDKLRIPIVLKYIQNKMIYESISKQNEVFIRILEKNKELMQILKFVDSLNLPNYYIAAGSVFQTIWNYFDNLDLNYNIKDIDLIYYDNNDLSVDKDIKIYNKIKEYCNKFNLNFEIDVSNEARMHLWKKKNENIDIEQYKNSEDAINKWIATVHAIGITLVNNEINIYAPYGLCDIYSKTIRPIKHKYSNKEIYDKKVNSWNKRFKNLNIIEW